ncbi:DSD1 family PLP-dependent enzyme [Thalassospira marina]|uniref:Alanine racemase n=1 Tax=Thalassospira marina TaxID=2048283 RepID=A0A2N3KX63_9PROT|nr:DSD1 family PLP-dependent enzyme [Thalassospira marina]PKR55169.1 alanine racemase [Thalassospira marina]
MTDPAETTPVALSTLQTPCLILDETRMNRNIARLTERLATAGVGFRPHLKTPKSIDVARHVMPQPTGPATVSTLREAEQFFAHGVRDITYAVGIAPDKLARVQKLRADGANITIVIDNIDQARAIAALSAPTNPIPVLIEIDCDGHRSGVKPDDAALLCAIADILVPNAHLAGVLTHAGESYSAKSIADLEAAAEQERVAAVLAATILRGAGHACEVVSVGSSPTAHFAKSYDGVTEVRAGVFVFFDLFQAGINVCRIDDIALSVLTTVIGHQREKGWIIVDAGWMAMSRDRGTAGQAVDQGYGLACTLDGTPMDDLIMVGANQEHGILAIRPGADARLPDLAVGSKLRILPNHACATAAQHGAYHVCRSGEDFTHTTWSRFAGW